MAEAQASKRPGGLLGWIARLRPGVLWVLYFVTGAVATILYDVLIEAGSVLQLLVGPLFILFWIVYPLFVVSFVSRVLALTSTKWLTRAVVAYAVGGLWSFVLFLLSYLKLTGAIELASEVDRGLAFSVLLLLAIWLYLWVIAAAVLLVAERDNTYSLWEVLGTVVQFILLPFWGAFFLQRRIRRRVHDKEHPDSRDRQLPMERLVLAPMGSGHLSLELTEIPNWWSFERYAEELLRRLDGRIVKKGNSVDMHIWNVEIETIPLRLVYEDFPNLICLESDSYPGDTLLRQLHKQLLAAG